MHTTNLRKVGGSIMLASSPPLSLDQLLHLEVGAAVGLVVTETAALVIEPVLHPQYTLDQLLAEAEASGLTRCRLEEREWVDAPAVGRELI